MAVVSMTIMVIMANFVAFGRSKQGTLVKSCISEVPLLFVCQDDTSLCVGCLHFNASPFSFFSLMSTSPCRLRPLLLFTRVHVVDSDTLLAADVAAPVKDAVTFLFAFLCPRVMATSAAQQVASLDAVRRHVADAVAGAERARFWVRLAKVRRSLVVHQVSLCGVFEECVFRT